MKGGDSMRSLIVGLLGVAVLAGGSAVAGAGTTTTYHGTFSGAVTYQNCPGAPTDAVYASGTWNVALHDATDATVSFNIFTQEDGSKRTHHVAYGGTFPQLDLAGHTFNIQFYAGSNPVQVYLDGTSFSYVVGPPYIAFGLDCPNGVVTYHGTTG
jgi:hypothetical protein